MGRHILLLGLVGVGASWVGSVPISMAQFGASGNPASVLMRPSPFGLGMSGGNPAYSPFLNPMVMPYTSNPDVMWYLYATGQYYGSSIPGTLRGRLNGDPNAPSQVDPAPPKKPSNGSRSQGTPKAQGNRRPGTRPAAEMPVSAATPGSSAAGYFYRGPGARGGAGRYYNRPLSQFQNNGR